MKPVSVRLDQRAGTPVGVDLGDGWQQVVQVAERWRASVGWWRSAPQRGQDLEYWRLLLADGVCCELQLELSSGRWSLYRRLG